MRIVDADILCYALIENHIATQYARPLIIKGLVGNLMFMLQPQPS